MAQRPKQDGLNTEYREAFDQLKAAVDALDAYLRRGPSEADALLREQLQVALQGASDKAEKIYSGRSDPSRGLEQPELEPTG